MSQRPLTGLYGALGGIVGKSQFGQPVERALRVADRRLLLGQPLEELVDVSRHH